MGTRLIWVDICHLAQFNFYKNFIRLASVNSCVLLSVLNRGCLPQVAKKELDHSANVEIVTVGVHKNSLLGILIVTNIIRLFSLFFLARRVKPHVCFSNVYQSALVSALLRIPRYQFGDDPEHKDYYLKRLFATQSLYCISDLYNTKVKALNAPKEWSYLSPKYFYPSLKCLEKYGLIPFQYIFVRDVDTRTTNYSGQNPSLISSPMSSFTLDVKVLFSLERRETRHLYPEDWIDIHETEPNIHSLIYYSRLVVSSGDSICREGACLGVPSLYCGMRNMLSLNSFINSGMIYKVEPKHLTTLVDNILEHDSSIKLREETRIRLSANWIDLNNYMLSLLDGL